METQSPMPWHEEKFDKIRSVFFVYTLPLAIACVSVVLNMAGIMALCSYHKKTNQNIILVYMSTAEIMMAANIIIWMAPRDVTFSISYLKYFTSLQWVLGTALVSSMYTLLIDRLICFTNPLKYKARLPRRRIKLILLVAAVISLVSGIPGFCIEHWFLSGYQSALYISLCLIILYITLFFVAYGFAFHSLKKSRRRLRTSTQTHNKRRLKKFAVPGVILTSYLLFYCVPFMAIFYYHQMGMQRNNNYKFGTAKVLSLLGFVVDPMTYIFLSKHYRAAFSNKCVSIMLSICGIFNQLYRPRTTSGLFVVRKEISST